jgi:hypothetical protein
MGKQSRMRLTQEDRDMMATALRQYAAGRISEERRQHALGLIGRLVDHVAGNPHLIAGRTASGKPRTSGEGMTEIVKSITNRV